MWNVARFVAASLRGSRRLSTAIPGPCIVHKRGTDILHDPWFNKVEFLNLAPCSSISTPYCSCSYDLDWPFTVMKSFFTGELQFLIIFAGIILPKKLEVKVVLASDLDISDCCLSSFHMKEASLNRSNSTEGSRIG